MAKTRPWRELRERSKVSPEQRARTDAAVKKEIERLDAAIVPAMDLEAYQLFRRVMREVGETLDVSRDPEIIANVRASQDVINHGEIIWDDKN
jgi:hypothetical protein